MSDIYADSPCANSDDKDAWFVNRRGRLEPEDAAEIRARHEEAARRHVEANVDPTVSSETIHGVAATNAQAEIDDLEKQNRVRLRAALRACYFDCPLKARLKCLFDGLEDRHGVRGGYAEEERREMVRVRDEHALTGRRVVDIAISADRREAMEEFLGGGEPDGDQPPGRTQPLAPEVGADIQHTEEDA